VHFHSYTSLAVRLLNAQFHTITEQLWAMQKIVKIRHAQC